MNKYKFIRFGFFSKAIKKYEDDISKFYSSQDEIYICFDQRPYMIFVDDKKIIACLWLEKDDNEREFSIVVHPGYRQQGIASLLMKELVSDILTKKIKETVCCVPVNPFMLRLIERHSFSQDYRNSEYWTYEL